MRVAIICGSKVERYFDCTNFFLDFNTILLSKRRKQGFFTKKCVYFYTFAPEKLTMPCAISTNLTSISRHCAARFNPMPTRPDTSRLRPSAGQ
jgi:hypothetical protein